MPRLSAAPLPVRRVMQRDVDPAGRVEPVDHRAGAVARAVVDRDDLDVERHRPHPLDHASMVVASL